MSWQANKKNENGLLNILVNVIIPVTILNKFSTQLGPVLALVLALGFPLIYGIYDLWKKRKINYFSLLGLINVSVTGSFALLHLDGHWFMIKEAFFPALIGLFVLFSSFTEKPFIESLLLNPQIMNIDLIHSKLEEAGEWDIFERHTKFCTQLLAASFGFSSILNYILANQIFTPIDPNLDQFTQDTLLNEQIGRMTGWGNAIVMVPSMIFLLGILWYLIRGIQKATGLHYNEFLNQ